MSPQPGTNGRQPTRRKAVAKSKANPATQRRNKRLSRTRQPDDMSLEAWQVALRQQFGREQNFRLQNVGGEPIFSEFEVTNPQTRRTYRVAIRGAGLGENYCSCPDFAVNTLGTCKHVEFTLARLGRKRGAQKALALGFRPVYSQIYLHYGAQRAVIFRPGSKCPATLKAYARRFFDERDRLKEDAYLRFHAFLKKAGGGRHEVRCYDDALEFIAEVRDKRRLEEAIARRFPRGIASAAWKKLLRVPLYPYQRSGALFAAKAGRCLIADDMGLGKTIQAIAAAEILACEAGIERVLVVSPTSLKHQWKQEIEKFTNRKALVVEGLQAQRAGLYGAESFYKLTNYDVVHRDMELIRRWQPDLIILDEAQRIKNWKTRTAQSVKQLASQHAIVLTGTPLENRLEELHSIVEFIDRFRLGPMFRFLAEHQHVDENGRVVGYRDLSKISTTLQPILVRRTKEKVLKELPERLEKRFFVPMTQQQMEHHEENREIVARIAAKWRRYGYLSEADQRRLLIALQNMRMACNSTYLLDQKTDHGVKADELISLLSEMFEQPHCKVVVFSQWLRMHELVVDRLRGRPWDHVLFHGGVPGPKRKYLVQQFKEDPRCRLFLATDAGGVGLNLQHASAVVNLDQPWNPAVLEQRIGRVHRLGQHRPVQVAHFISQGTIEEGMLALLAFKSAMFSGVLDGGKDEVFLGGSRLKRFMESVEKATGSIPQSMPQASEPSAASEEVGEDLADVRAAEPASRAASPSEEIWTDVVAAGMSLLDKLGKALATGQADRSKATLGDRALGDRALGDRALGDRALGGLAESLVTRDDSSGQPYLKLPLPEPETMQKVLELFAALAKGK
ncbi:MAG: DEAD/DEAH box helicase [Pirellulales bacterium]|nr:DEAD/DEAH box helicase [Pirellulales bacterium]